MASSRQDQSSYASPNESHFTAEWILAALSKQDGTILYRDIQAALADAFADNPEQTPFFVNQGSGLEEFGQVTEEMRTLRTSRSKSSEPEKPDDSIAELIEAEVAKRDQSFLPHDVALEAAERSRLGLSNSSIDDRVVAKFYSLSVQTDGKLLAIPKIRTVAGFAEEQSWPKRYFVKVGQEIYKVRVPKRSLFTNLVAYNFVKDSDEEFTTEQKQRPSSLEVTESLPFEVAILNYASKHASLSAYLAYIGVVHSLTEVMVLSAIVRLIKKGWDTTNPDLSDVQWRYQSYPWSSVAANPNIIWADSKVRAEAEIRAALEAFIPKSDATNIGTPTISHTVQLP